MKLKKITLFLLFLFFINQLLPVFANYNTLNITNGIEGINNIFEKSTVISENLEETHDIISSYSVEDSDRLEDNFLLNENIVYKYLNIPHYFLKENQNVKKRIYSFNQGRTYVINNHIQETTKEKIIELRLSLSDKTTEVYLAIDHSQSSLIPNNSKFTNAQSTIEIKELPVYLKINKTNLQDSLFLTLNPNISNLSLQIIELDNYQKVTGVYSSNILQLDVDSFNKYTMFQMNKHILEFFCPYCEIEDFGVNKNGFSSCGRSIFEPQKKSITEYLNKKENVCLVPDGTKIAGFTNESLYLFGLDRLYFEWNANIPSDFFDYGEYYVDEDQFRIAVSKKLDTIENKEFISLGEIKYKIGKNKLISKVGTYIELDLLEPTYNISNENIDDALNSSIVALKSIPEEYKKLTILDLVNNEPNVSDLDFDKYMFNFFKKDFYKIKDYHTHYQITLEKYLDSFNDLKEQSKINDYDFSNFLYSSENVLRGYSNIYFSEGLDYFIYNLKPIYDLEYSNRLLNNIPTKMFGNFWKLNLVDTQEFYQPKTVVVNISDYSKKEANVHLSSPSDNLYVNYYLDNFYYSYNNLFFESINALSYNRSAFFENTTSVFDKYPNINNNYEDIQDGNLFFYDFEKKIFSLKYTSPIIITKSTYEEDLIIKYHNGKEYVIYPNYLAVTSNSSIYIDNYSIIFYPLNTVNDYPIIVESLIPLVFNVVVSEQQLNEKYVYKLNINVEKNNLSTIINNISNGNMCFSLSENGFSIWKNIDEELIFGKNKNYNYLTFQEEEEFNDLSINYAIQTHNGKDYENNFFKVHDFLEYEIKVKNLEKYINYKKAHNKLLLQEPNLNKDFTNLFDCKDTLICEVIKTKNIPLNSFFERFKTSCKANTPTECVNYWSNPKVNFCAAFTRVFNNHFYDYKFDSANAWDLSKQQNNISIWKTIKGSFPETMYDSLIPGSILGIKQNNTSYIDKEYSHVVTYLGKKGSKHYVIHSWGNTLKIEQLDVFLKTTARGKNAYGYFENGEIKEVLISKNLYSKLKEVARNNGIFLSVNETFSNEVFNFSLDFFNSFNFNFGSSDYQSMIVSEIIYNDLKKIYLDIIENYSSDEFLDINNKNLESKFILIVLGKYKKAFLVNKTDNKLNIYAEYPVSVGINGFGCEINGLKTPTGLFKISKKIGDNCSPLQIISNDLCLTENNNPILASLNIDKSYEVTRKIELQAIDSICSSDIDYKNILIHGTNYENEVGFQKSSGNIRLLNEDILSLYDFLPIDSYVYIHNEDIDYSFLIELEKKLTSYDDFEFFYINYRDPKIYDNKTEQSPSLYPRKFVLPPEIDLRTPEKKFIDSLEKGIDNCYTTNPKTLEILRSKNLNLAKKETSRKDLSSIVVPSKFSLSYEDILKIASPKPNDYKAHEKFITAIPTLYNLCAIYGIDPVFVLAKFRNEKSMYNLIAGNYDNGELVRSNNPTGIKRINGCACGGKRYLKGEFCQYPTLDAGFEATLLNLINTKSYNNKTLGEVAKIWAEDPNYDKNLLKNINYFYNLIK